VRSRLREELTPKVNEQLLALRQAAMSQPNLEIDSQVFDALEVKLGVVGDTVCDWLQVSDGSVKIEDFDLKDLAKYIMATLFASSISQDRLFISLKFPGYPQDTYSRLIRGEHFDFFLELLHNSIMNAFVHSGLGQATFAELHFSFDDDSFSLHSTSNISRDRASYFFNNHRKLQQSASSRAVLEQAIEGGSGLARIKKSALEAFGNLPDIEIKRNHPKAESFDISFSFTTTGEMVARRTN
jgi:hypothetical protein